MKIKLTSNSMFAGHNDQGLTLCPRRIYVTEQRLDAAIQKAGLAEFRHLVVQMADRRWTAVFVDARMQPLQACNAGFCYIG